MQLILRSEHPDDIPTLARLTEAAFRDVAHSSHTESFILSALRRAGALTLSIVALEHDTLVGHVAVSPVHIAPRALPTGETEQDPAAVTGWYGLGPISVWPERQEQGIGTALMEAMISALQAQGAAGCVVLGDPAYYTRFGFRPCPGLLYPDVPQEYFMARTFRGALPLGTVAYHDAFTATA